MLHRQLDNIEWLEFEHLAEQKKLTHRIYLKHGGHSCNTYESLNFSFQVGDQPEHVTANVNKVSRQLNLQTLVRGNLSHGNRVVHIDNNHLHPEGEYDAMTTQTPHIGLVITHADCQATLLYDPIHHVLANIHCGWRGNVTNIYAATIQAMRKKYHTKPENLLAGISPSLGPKHAEFINYHTEFPEVFWQFQTTPNHFDLWAIATSQLLDCGLLPHHIECANRCTYAEPEHFFSYRRMKTSGRHGTIAFLN
jgi:purine-nucleoside/S-methyl-5'-thioadenosine phosphorylase / adenosine deaminase